MSQESRANPLRDAGRGLLAAWLLLIGLLVLWWLSQLRWPPDLGGAATGLTILPLALMLPALARGSRHAYAGSTLLLTPYMGWGITETVANPDARLFAGALVLSALACFVLSILSLRESRSA